MVIARPLPFPVHCTNCGGSDALAFWSLIVAGIALLLALGALYIALREHLEFMRQLQARANFDLTVDAEGDLDANDPTLIVSDASSIVVRLRVGLDNTGTKAAGPTVLNAVVPSTLSFFHWCDQAGTREPDSPQPMPTSDKLEMPGFGAASAHWISKTLNRVALRTGYVTWFHVQAPVPSDLLVRVVAESDDLPDDVKEVIVEKAYRIRRPG